LKELARHNLAKAAYAAGQFAKHGKILFSGAPRFNEFVVEMAEDVPQINRRLLRNKIVGGLALKKFYPELGNAALWCCTELTTRTAIDRAVKLVAAGERSELATEELAEVVR
jgi:glycine dehydrogenase subunit 1